MQRQYLEEAENHWTKVTQQQSEVTDPNAENLYKVNPSVLLEAGFDPMLIDSPDRNPKPPKPERKPAALPDVQVLLDSLDDARVKSCTGFASKTLLLTYIGIACNGNTNAMQETTSSLTWFEEWYLYFDWIWGRESSSLSSLQSKYSISRRTVKRLLKAKKKVELEARSRWPLFVTLAEDQALMSDHWKAEYPDRRIIFWDNTNVNIPAPSVAAMNRETYSSYYGGNVAKGGVFLFLCGWMGTWALWGGAIADTDYVPSKERDF